MSEVHAPSNLRGLEDSYDIRGELRGIDSARQYIGRTKDGAAEVAIAVFHVPNGGENNALSHFAADAQVLARSPHPAIPRVLEGRWVGNDAFAVVSERSTGETLGEQLERGEKFTNARIAMLLTEIAGVLEWARENGVVHRGVTPDSLMFEHGTNRLRIALTPTPIPMTGVPDACADARTIGTLAWSMLCGSPYPSAHAPKSIAEICPNLATRVVDAVDRMIACKDHLADAPDVYALLGVIAAGDALKQAEIELSAMKEEYDEQHQRELQKCEIQRQETEQHAAEQAAILAGEREEFNRQMEEQRAAMAAERAEFERIMTERKERFAAVRAELDQQRVELERRLTELEAYRADVERVRDEALAARDEAKAELSRANAARAEAEKAARAIAEPAKLERVPVELPVVPAMPIMHETPRPEPVKLAKPPKPPKWKQIQPVDLEHTDEENIPDGSRPRWMIPSFVGAALLILIAVIIGVSRHSSAPATAIGTGASAPVPTAQLPRGGFLTQSAGGAVAPSFSGAPIATTPATPAAAAAADTARQRPLTQHEVDSIAQIQQRLRRQIDPRPRRRPTQEEVDSVNTPPGLWKPSRPDTTATVTPPPIANPAIPPVTTVKRDSAAPKKDSIIKRDSIKPDTARKS
jgi:hypothetical protein